MTDHIPEPTDLAHDRRHSVIATEAKQSIFPLFK